VSHPFHLLGKHQGYTFRKKDAILFQVLAQNRWIKATQFPSFLLAEVAIFLLAYFTRALPFSLEEDFNGRAAICPSQGFAQFPQK